MVGHAIVEEMMSGQWAKFFKVTAAVLSSDSTNKRDELRQLGCQVLEYEETMDQNAIKNYVLENQFKAMILAGTAQKDDSRELMTWIDVGRRTTVDYVLMLSAPAADKAQTVLAKRYQDLESYLSSNARYYTILRTSLLVDVLKFYAEDIKKEKILKLPLTKDGYFSPIDAKDVAHCVALIMVDAGVHHEQVYEITGPSTKVFFFSITCSLKIL